ncbi:hypothetical protein GCM10010174_70070 [Kutzneria viridogrisea]|uniref:Uncharacterized protein n=1 Tax=Kutzneria viridogrisea TaxID=47990 RepID=A0ABR6BB07_9PSEU|nr:hypothetical protein [Kutzneria viridogrisea]
MARTAVPYSNLVPNGHLTDPTPTTADATNGHTIAKAKPELTMLRVFNTAGTAKNATVKAGAYPPAIASVQGDFTVSVASNGIEWLGPFESGRFLQADGSLSLDLGSGFTGSVTAFLMPRNT